MKILVLSSHTQSLFWFRMDMMKSFLESGHDVVAVGQEKEELWSDRFAEYGINYRRVSVERNGLNPFSDIRTINELSRVIRQEKPDKIFSYQAKSVIYGSIAAKINNVNEYYSLIAGLGSIFRGNNFKSKVIKVIMTIQYRFACCFSKKVFFQNVDDLHAFTSRKIVEKHKCQIINGSGVNLEMFRPNELPENASFLFIGRLIKDKGICEYLEASRVLKKRFPKVRFMLVGPYDTNPSALRQEELEPYLSDGVIEYYGEQRDVRPFISQCNVYVLPSYHEGTPKTVLEAMALGRAIVTTDAPGCRETVVNGKNGLLVKVKSVQDLIDKMETLILDPNLRKTMGNESLAIAKKKYDVRLVNADIQKGMQLS